MTKVIIIYNVLIFNTDCGEAHADHMVGRLWHYMEAFDLAHGIETHAYGFRSVWQHKTGLLMEPNQLINPYKQPLAMDS